MKLTRNMVVAATAFAITGITGIGSTAAQAGAAEHCEPGDGKVELDGDHISIDTDLDDGTTVCIKVGRFVTVVEVDGGAITNDSIRNRNGVLQGISYYVWYGSTTTS